MRTLSVVCLLCLLALPAPADIPPPPSPRPKPSPTSSPKQEALAGMLLSFGVVGAGLQLKKKR